MEGKELRIGNYVNHNGFAPITIDAVDIIHCQQHPEAYKPIELTEEWLLKLGFNKSKFSSNCFKITNGYKFDFAGGEVLYLDSIRLEHIKYIHQLQNLHFALGGEELTIKS
ncbi:hypothetical protein CMU68_10170 [Elizabethkingia anophelis]|nr:hypothetical protein [Elizabethkingia anophelis]MCT4171342.1 hypothetical protein [Elizabethkingia anophelis]MCT4245756.1 hypothetical protein [Elizabethkingia anophelis]MCT4249456.1 hypothetical protein [Elizabethkingia anophelis]MCT4260480.1 hypothetical protein [Elizabethkingia anophelis]